MARPPLVSCAGQAAENSTKAAALESKAKSDGWFGLMWDSVRAAQSWGAEGRRVVNQAAILGAHE
jgi:hypothetical protein